MGRLVIVLALVFLALTASAESTFEELPADVKAKVDIRLARTSDEIAASPFATLTSFEVHGPAEDAGVIECARRLGVKHFVMHNIHGSLKDPDDARLNAWLDRCEAAKIEVRCILHSTDLELWRAALKNYGRRIKHFAYLNEPNQPTNNDHTKPHWMPEKYVDELRRMKAVRDEIAPDVKLGGPELAMLMAMEEKPFPWLRRAIESGLLGLIDEFTFHPYRQGYSPRNVPENPSTFEGRPGQGYATYEEQIGVLRQRVGAKPLIINEVGWSTTPRGPICEHTQAKFALRQQIMDFSLSIECAVYFLLRERHVDRPFPLWHLENHFGIAHPDNSPKPAYAALQALYSQLDSACRRVADAPVNWSAPGVKWHLFEDASCPVPALKLFYWLPVPAQDDFKPVRAEARLMGVRVENLPVSDAPRCLRLHKIGGRWGWPVVIDMTAYAMDTKVNWKSALAPPSR